MKDSKKLVTDVFSSLAKGNAEQVESVLADDFKSTVMSNTVDKSQYISAFKTLRKGIPDLQISVHDLEATGNTVHARLDFTGTHSGELASILPGFKQLSPSGKKVHAENVEVDITLKDDKIREIKNIGNGKGIFREVYSQLTTQ